MSDDNRSLTIISIDSMLVYKNKYYLQVYLDSGVDKTGNTQMTNYLDGNLFETHKDFFDLVS